MYGCKIGKVVVRELYTLCIYAIIPFTQLGDIHIVNYFGRLVTPENNGDREGHVVKRFVACYTI